MTGTRLLTLIAVVGAALALAGCGGNDRPSAIGEQAQEIKRERWMQTYTSDYALVGEVEDCAWLRDWARTAQRSIDRHLKELGKGVDLDGLGIDTEQPFAQLDAARARMDELGCSE
jgi:hypothetical protein